jgi:hypothetical protein
MFGYKDLKEKTYLFNDFCQIFNLDILDISDISDDFPVKIIYEKDKKIDDMCISRVSIIFKKYWFQKNPSFLYEFPVNMFPDVYRMKNFSYTEFDELCTDIYNENRGILMDSYSFSDVYMKYLYFEIFKKVVLQILINSRRSHQYYLRSHCTIPYTQKKITKY